MSADFNTTIKASGSREGLKAILEVARYYEDERLKQYQAGEPYYVDYLKCVKVCPGGVFDDNKATQLATIGDIKTFVDGLKDTKIVICAEGPYGRGFATLDEIDLYNDITSKIDASVEFEGFSSGSNGENEQLLKAVYKGGKLKVQLSFEDDAEDEDEEESNDVDIEEKVENVLDVLSLDDFMFMFKINGEILPEDYECIIEEIFIYKNDYEEVFGDREIFEDYISGYIDSDDAYSISDEDFQAAIKTLGNLGIKESLI